VSPADRNESREDPDDFQLIDVEQLKHSLLFTVHAIRRRRGVVAATFVLVLGLGGLGLWVMPRTYRVEAELLAQKNALMPALGNPSRAVPPDADRPTRAAAETVLRRDNLLNLIKQTDLMNRWQQERPALLRFKDRVINRISPLSDEDRLNAMVGFLEKQLKVGTTDTTIDISVDWTSADQAFQLVNTALQNFLEERHTAEVSTIAETISILEGHATALKEAIDSSVEDMRRAPKSKSDSTSRPVVVFRRDPAREAVRAELAEVKTSLDAKRRAIKDVEEARRRRLAELQVELAQQRTVYAERHPTIVKLQQSISTLEEDSPQLQELRDEEAALQSDLIRLSANRGDPVAAAPLTDPSASETQPRKRGAVSLDGSDDEYARTRLRFAMEKYDVLLSRIDNARIELDTARAAFKYRYSIVRPALVPKRPVKPNVPLVAAATVLAAAILSVLAAVLADYRSGRLLEPWQVERLLGLQLLGELPRS